MIIRSRLRIKRSIYFIAIAALALLTACSADPEANAPQLYVNSCSWCHNEGTGGAPVTGDKEDWERRTAKGMAKVYANAIDGFEGATGIMPAKASRPELTDQEVKDLVDWMVQAPYQPYADQ
jgi:cytochrome c5